MPAAPPPPINHFPLLIKAQEQKPTPEDFPIVVLLCLNDQPRWEVWYHAELANEFTPLWWFKLPPTPRRDRYDVTYYRTKSGDVEVRGVRCERCFWSYSVPLQRHVDATLANYICDRVIMLHRLNKCGVEKAYDWGDSVQLMVNGRLVGVIPSQLAKNLSATLTNAVQLPSNVLNVVSPN